MTGRWMRSLMLWSLSGVPATLDAQARGTFRWQLQPFCNVATLVVTASQLDGTGDQCGNGADQASALGTAFQNLDGTIGTSMFGDRSPFSLPLITVVPNQVLVRAAGTDADRRLRVVRLAARQR